MESLEKRKITIDLMKHIATLAAAFIAVLAASFGHLNTTGEPNYPIAIGVGSLLICIVSSITVIVVVLGHIDDMSVIKGSRTGVVLSASIFGSIAGFGSGLLCISMVVLRAVF